MSENTSRRVDRVVEWLGDNMNARHSALCEGNPELFTGKKYPCNCYLREKAEKLLEAADAET